MNNIKESTLLIVDDIPENIDVLRGILNTTYTLKVANSGQLALKIVALQPPDLILLDVMMPEMDGYEVCRQLKENESTRNIPIIFVTARGEVADETYGFELGASDYIVKPVSPPLVRARVRAHLALSNQRYSLEQLVTERTEELEHSNQQLRQTHFDMLLQLGRAADYRDNATGKHVLRVGAFSKLLGLACGFLESRAEMLRYASMMHDIGKVGVPDNILLKQGNLTEEEFEVIKKHPQIGADIIGEHDAEVLKMARDIALTHHEKWNGQGYPCGMSGTNIPIVARIVAIADVFDALTSVRPYKPAWTIKSALEQIAKKAGQQFDPELVRLFMGMEAQVRQIMLEYSDVGDISDESLAETVVLNAEGVKNPATPGIVSP